jgi:hypothetical protein
VANEERVRIVAGHRGRAVDVAQVIRKPASYVVHFMAAPGVHYSWRDGERHHVTAERGDLADVGYDRGFVEAVRDATGTAKHWSGSWESPHWSDLPEGVERTLARYDYADRLDDLPDADARRARLFVALGDDDAVETAHYLCRPGAATDAFLARLALDPYGVVWRCDRWEPWSIVTATLRPHAIGRATSP